MQYLHATSVSIDGRGVLIRGPSASGKSDLALRLIDAGALLIADDQTEICKLDDGLILSVPAQLAGKIEIRGFGILKLPHDKNVGLDLIIDLRRKDEIERMPENKNEEILSLIVPVLQLNAFEASAVAKIHAVLKGVQL